ncbi:MAG: hypothetical protein ACFFG0_36595, partial [Candidatus Thorarchaeota archaeon]
PGSWGFPVQHYSVRSKNMESNVTNHSPLGLETWTLIQKFGLFHLGPRITRIDSSLNERE